MWGPVRVNGVVMEDTGHEETKGHPGSEQEWHRGKTAGWPGGQGCQLHHHTTSEWQSQGTRDIFAFRCLCFPGWL